MAWAAWTAITLSKQCSAEVAGDWKETDVTQPEKALALVREAGIRVWTAHTWRFRRENAVNPPYYTYKDPPWSDSALADGASPVWPSRFDSCWRACTAWLFAEYYGGAAHSPEELKKNYEDCIAKQKDLDEIVPEGDDPECTDITTVLGIVNSIIAAFGITRTDENICQIYQLVKQAGIQLWDGYDWKFTHVQATLTIAADADVIAVPTDFKELDQRMLEDGDKKTLLRFTESTAQFQRIADRYESTDKDAPVIAILRRDHSEAAFKWEIKISPICDIERTYDYWYVVKNPWSWTVPLADNATPPWPDTFNMGWLLYASMLASRQFVSSKDRVKDMIAASVSLFKDWERHQLAENDETITTGDSEIIEDGYADSALINGSYNDYIGYGSFS